MFTNRVPFLNYGSAAALAAASRALKGYNDILSEQALTAAIGAWNKEHNEPINNDSERHSWFFSNITHRPAFYFLHGLSSESCFHFNSHYNRYITQF